MDKTLNAEQRRLISKKEFEDLLKKEGYELLTEYKNLSTKVTLKHKKCGNVYDVTPYTFKCKGRRCAKCNGGKRLTNEEFLIKLKEKCGDKFTPLEEYKNTSTPIKFRCNECGNIIIKKPVYILQGHGCAICSNQQKHDTNWFKKQVKKLTGNEYTVLGEYIGNKKPILIKHNKCNTEYNALPKDFVYNGNYRCPYCSYLKNRSKGEKEIEKVLKKYNIEYEVQSKEFKSKSSKRYLSFDFKLYDENTGNPIFIEFDGAFHYKSFDNSEKSLREYNAKLRNDKLKEKYCKKHGYTLIRIPFWEINRVEEVIKKYIVL